MYQSLVDYDMAMLQAIAARRAVTLATLSKQEAVNTLTHVLLSPAETAIILADLSEAEQEAVQLLLVNGGQVDGPRFNRDFGC